MFRILRLISIPCLLLLLGAPIYAQTEETEAAQKSAEAWLQLVDAGQYGASWEATAPSFRSKVPKEQWETTLEKVRTPLGKAESRKLIGAKYTTELPNAPKGEYVVIQYDTSFADKGPAIETVTPMKHEDGSWRITGYFIRPKP
jgi:Protein of unknown function (DUF4019)